MNLLTNYRPVVIFYCLVFVHFQVIRSDKNSKRKTTNSNDPNETPTKKTSTNSEDNVDFESEVSILTVVHHRLAVTRFSQKSRNIRDFARSITFRVRLPDHAYVTDFALATKEGKTLKSRVVHDGEMKRMRSHGASHFILSGTKGCNEFHFRFRVPAGEQVELNLIFEKLLERSKGRYEIELYNSPCHGSGHPRNDSSSYADRAYHNRSHHHQQLSNNYHHNKITKLIADVIVKESMEIVKVTTVPMDATPPNIQQLRAKISQMFPESIPVYNESGNIPVRLIKRFANKIHYQFLYKDPNSNSSRPSSSSSPPGLNLFLPREVKLFYDVKRDMNVGEIQTRGNYFAHFFSPTNMNLLNRDIIFLVQSDSMHLSIINTALKELLDNKLTAKDKFNIIFFPPNFKANQSENQPSPFRPQQSPHQIGQHQQLLLQQDEELYKIVIGMAEANLKNVKNAGELLANFTQLHSQRPADTFLNSVSYTRLRDGLTQSLDLLSKQKDSDPYDTRLSMIFYVTTLSSSPSSLSSSFLSTRTLSMSAEQEKVLLSFKRANQANCILVPFFLHDRPIESIHDQSHWRFLEILAKQNGGKIYSYSNESYDSENGIDNETETEKRIQNSIIRAFDEVSRVTMKNVNFNYADITSNKPLNKNKKENKREENLKITSVPSFHPILKDGDELIVAGHFHDESAALQDHLRVNGMPEIRSAQRELSKESVLEHGNNGKSPLKNTKFKVTVSGTGNTGFISLDSGDVVRKRKEHRSEFDSGDYYDGDDYDDKTIATFQSKRRKINHLEKIWTHLVLRDLEDKLFLMVGRNGEEEVQVLKVARKEVATQHSFMVPGNCLLLEGDRHNRTVCTIDEVNADDDGELRRRESKKTASAKSFVDNDPHFVVRIDGLTEPVCFDIAGRPGKILQLLHDRSKDVTVNALIIRSNSRGDNQTYIGRISIVSHEHGCAIVDTRWIQVNGTKYTWRSKINNQLLGNDYLNITSVSRRSVRIQAGQMEFRILRHVHGESNGNKTTYLGFYIKNEPILSDRACGIIGQFSDQTAHAERPSFKLKLSDPERTFHLQGRLIFKQPHTPDIEVTAHLSLRRNMENRQRTICWHIANQGLDALGLSTNDNLVPTLCHRGRPPKFRHKPLPVAH